MKTSAALRVTATGDITTRRAVLRGVVLTGGADAASATVRTGGGSGTVLAVVKAAINTTASVQVDDIECPGGIHVTVTGTTPDVTVIYA